MVNNKLLLTDCLLDLRKMTDNHNQLKLLIRKRETIKSK